MVDSTTRDGTYAPKLYTGKICGYYAYFLCVHYRKIRVLAADSVSGVQSHVLNPKYLVRTKVVTI